MQLFRGRHEAGCQLAERLRWAVAADPFTLVVGLAKGGVAVGSALAAELHTELDVLLVKELKMPARPALSIGAMVSGGLTVLNEEAMQYMNVSDATLARLTSEAGQELRSKERLYRDGRPPLPVKGRTVILTDDGFSSAAALRAAAKALRPQAVKRLVVAVPMASQQSVREFGPEADDVVCLALPPTLGSPAMWYEDYTSVADETIRRVLEDAAHERKVAAAGTY